MKLLFSLLTIFVQSLPVSNATEIDTVPTGSSLSSNRVRFKIENRDQCPEEETTFCEGEVCREWICTHGTLEHDSCELDFGDEAPVEDMMQQYRTCSCHSFIGPIEIFTGCKWKSTDIRPASLDIEASGEQPTFEILEEEFMTHITPIPETTAPTKIRASELPYYESEENFMLFDVEESEKTSDISQIFVGSFISCLRSLPGKAEILCSLEETTRPCEIKCEDETDHNVCLYDEEGCFWRNSFNRNCYSFEESFNHERARYEEHARQEVHVDREETELSEELQKFREIKSDGRHLKKILREDGTYVHGFDLMLSLIEEMYDNGLMQKL